jgi:hypothetical protein
MKHKSPTPPPKKKAVTIPETELGSQDASLENRAGKRKKEKMTWKEA